MLGKMNSAHIMRVSYSRGTNYYVRSLSLLEKSRTFLDDECILIYGWI